MRKILFASAALAITTCLPPAAAAAPDFTAMHNIRLMQRLMHGDKAPARKAPTVRSATLKFKGTIHKKGSFSKPLRCSVDFFYSDEIGFFSEEKSQEVEFDGDTGTCTVIVPFKWSLENLTFDIGASARVGNVESSRMAAKRAEPEIPRETEIDFDDIPLPDEGQTVTLSFNVDM